MDSNGGSRINGDQFLGWYAHDDHEEWNSCRRDYPPPNSNNYNAAGDTEQEGESGAEWYGALVFDRNAGFRGCARYRGFTLTNKWMELRELDAPDDDERTGDLWFPDLHVDLTCDEQGCDYATSSTVSPNSVQGYYDDPYAEIFMIVDAELIEGTAPIPEYGESFSASLAATLSGGRALRYFAAPPFVPAGIGSYLNGAVFRRSFVQRSSGGTFDLTVVDAQDGKPIERATVLFVDEIAGEIIVSNVRTSTDGKSVINPLSTDSQELFVFAHGYGHGRRQIPRAGDTGPAMTTALNRAARVSGLVTDANGTPVGKC